MLSATHLLVQRISQRKFGISVDIEKQEENNITLIQVKFLTIVDILITGVAK